MRGLEPEIARTGPRDARAFDQCLTSVDQCLTISVHEIARIGPASLRVGSPAPPLPREDAHCLKANAAHPPHSSSPPPLGSEPRPVARGAPLAATHTRAGAKQGAAPLSREAHPSLQRARSGCASGPPTECILSPAKRDPPEARSSDAHSLSLTLSRSEKREREEGGYVWKGGGKQAARFVTAAYPPPLLPGERGSPPCPPSSKRQDRRPPLLAPLPPPGLSCTAKLEGDTQGHACRPDRPLPSAPHSSNRPPSLTRTNAHRHLTIPPPAKLIYSTCKSLKSSLISRRISTPRSQKLSHSIQPN